MPAWVTEQNAFSIIFNNNNNNKPSDPRDSTNPKHKNKKEMTPRLETSSKEKKALNAARRKKTRHVLMRGSVGDELFSFCGSVKGFTSPLLCMYFHWGWNSQLTVVFFHCFKARCISAFSFVLFPTRILPQS